MSNFTTLADIYAERSKNLGPDKESRDIQTQVPPEDADRDRSAHQLYSGTFSVTAPGSQQFNGNQIASRDLIINTWPSQQHAETDWSQTGHIRPAPPPPLRIIYIARALYDFHGIPPEELWFNAGDQIELTEGKTPSQNGWLKGRVKEGSGKEGLVPKDYVEIRPDDLGLSK